MPTLVKWTATTHRHLPLLAGVPMKTMLWKMIMTTPSEFRYIVESMNQTTFYVVDSFGQSIVKILDDLETAEDWRDYYNDLDTQDMWRSA